MVLFDSILLIAGSAAMGLAFIVFGLRGALKIWKATPNKSMGRPTRGAK